MLIMANENTQINLPKRVAEYCNKLYWLTINLNKTDASIGFLKKALYAHVTRKFSQIKGQFVTDEEKHQGERRMMLSHVSKYAKCLKETTKEQDEVSEKIITIRGRLILKCLQNKIICTSKCNRMESYITKDKKTEQINNIQFFHNT